MCHFFSSQFQTSTSNRPRPRPPPPLFEWHSLSGTYSNVTGSRRSTSIFPLPLPLFRLRSSRHRQRRCLPSASPLLPGSTKQAAQHGGGTVAAAASAAAASVAVAAARSVATVHSATAAARWWIGWTQRDTATSTIACRRRGSVGRAKRGGGKQRDGQRNTETPPFTRAFSRAIFFTRTHG